MAVKHRGDFFHFFNSVNGASFYAAAAIVLLQVFFRCGTA